MISIYEQGSGHGAGHGVSFILRRFDEICSERLATAQQLEALKKVVIAFQSLLTVDSNQVTEDVAEDVVFA